jgi:hypothetical protein
VQDQYVTFSAAWFTLSLINAGLAQSKQRSGLAWWFVSLFIGPLATLLIVAWPPGDQPMQAPPGTMDRNQAILVGAGLLLIVGVVVALGYLAGR